MSSHSHSDPDPEAIAKAGRSTRAVHAGNRPAENAVNTPIFLSSTFRLDDHIYGQWAEGDWKMQVYTRFNNPTLSAAAAKVAALEGAQEGLVFASGLAAIHAAITAFCEAGDRFVTTRDIYGGTYSLFVDELTRMAIKPLFTDLQDLRKARGVFNSATNEANPPRLLFVESMSNPLLRVYDLPALAELAHDYGALLLVDNTFATPVLCNPLDHGADLVIHSATKYLGGHSDLVAGTVAGSEELVKQVWPRLVHFGACMDPHAAYMLERGLKTLPVRVERMVSTARELALWLDEHPLITRVHYPGLPGHEHHSRAQRLFKGPGAMISFVVKGGDAAGLELMRELAWPVEATSLGGVESLISMPFNTSHLPLPPEEQEKQGIEPGFVRLSVGLEDPEDLIGDLARVLEGL